MDMCIPVGVMSTGVDSNYTNDYQVTGDSHAGVRSDAGQQNKTFILDSLSFPTNQTSTWPEYSALEKQTEDAGSADSYKIVEDVLYQRVTIIICFFGIVGNILNLIVLTRKGLQKTMDRMEKSAHVGLVALAISDMLFCVTVLPHAWVDKTGKFYYERRDFNMYYVLHGDTIINIFIMSSTWLTVAMAASRYLAICHPLRARDIIGMTFAKASICTVFILCVLFNLPRFWNTDIETMDCVGGWEVYFPLDGYMKRNAMSEKVYMWFYFVLGILLPLLILAFCNAYLIRALRQSAKMRAQYKKPNAADSKHHITLTLIIIVIMYIVLVLPAEVIGFFKQMVKEQSHMTESLNLGIAFVNVLQALNFSCNFILYCAINVHFRRTMRDIFCCCFPQFRHPRDSSSTRYESVTATTSAYTRQTALSEV